MVEGKRLMSRFYSICSLLLLWSNCTAIAQTQAPTFYLQDLEGEKFFASRVYGERANDPSLVVLSFFATWCKPCLAEVPQLELLSKAYPNIKFYLISFKDKPEAAQKWVDKLNCNLPVLLDGYGVTAEKFNVVKENDQGAKFAALPTLFVINREGTIVYTHEGYVPGDEVELEKILKSL